MSNNPQYNPEAFGMTVVAEIEYSSGNYEFDTRIVWKNAEGRLFTARDSGCSCPIPFDDFRTIESLDTFDWQALKNEVDEHLKGSYANITPLEAKEFLNTVEAALANSPSQNA
jgi:hypothetical protein